MFGSCSADHVARGDPARAQTCRDKKDPLFHIPPRQDDVLRRQAPAHPGARARGARASARAYRRRPPAARQVFALSLSSRCIAKYINRMDEALILARVQFGLNIGFHILFPTITIGARLAAAVRSACATSAPRDPAWLRDLQALGQGVRAHLRAGRGDRHHDELPVRHQLAGLHEHASATSPGRCSPTRC